MTHCSNGHELAIRGGWSDGTCVACCDERASEYRRRRRREALLVYGDGSCAACGLRPDDVADLELDHVNGDGREHRERTGLGRYGAGEHFALWLRRHGWPTDPPLQMLCVPCHREKTARERRAA